MSPSAEAPRRGEFIVPATAVHSYNPLLINAGRCRSCQAAIVWTKTDTGASMPLSVKTAEERDGKIYALSHFSDCENAAQHRKKKGT